MRNAVTRLPRRPRSPRWSSRSIAWMTARYLRFSPASCNPTTRFNCAGRSEAISSGPQSNGRVRCCWSAAGVASCRSCACCGTGNCQAAPCRQRSCIGAHTRGCHLSRRAHGSRAKRSQFTLRMTLTRDSAPGWSGRVGRIDLPAVQALLEGLGGVADSFVCGPDGFVEAASALLLQAGQPRRRDPHRAVWANGNVALLQPVVTNAPRSVPVVYVHESDEVWAALALGAVPSVGLLVGAIAGSFSRMPHHASRWPCR